MHSPQGLGHLGLVCCSLPSISHLETSQTVLPEREIKESKKTKNKNKRKRSINNYLKINTL